MGIYEELLNTKVTMIILSIDELRNCLDRTIIELEKANRINYYVACTEEIENEVSSIDEIVIARTNNYKRDERSKKGN